MGRHLVKLVNQSYKTCFGAKNCTQTEVKFCNKKAIFGEKNTLYKYEENYWGIYMGLKAGLQILQQTGKTVANYADDAARFVARGGDDAVGIFCRKPVTVNPAELKGLRFAPEAIGDTVKITKTAFKIPSAEKLKLLLKEQGMVDDFITDNNSIFLEELLKRFPLKQGEKTNKVVQDLMTCLEDINHASFTDKTKFLDDFLMEASKVAKDFAGIFTQSTTGLFSKRAVLQAKYNNPERYQEIMDLLTLHKQGKAPKWTLQTLFPESSFHPLPKGDMQRLLRGEHYYPQLTELADDVIAKLEVGEAFSVGKDMFVKTAKGYEKLKIDAQTYEKLFPPIERYALSQGPLGNCHLMATMDSIIKNPEGRIEFYKLFEQVDNGVKCTLAGYKDAGIIYSFDDLSQLYSKTNMHGSLGHKMIESTYATNYYAECIKSPYAWRVEELTQGDKIKIFDVAGDYENVEDHIRYLIGKNSKSIFRRQTECFTTPVVNLANSEQKGINIVNNSSSINNLRKGLFTGHYYGADLNKGVTINPWNSMEVINTSPFLFDDITYIV